MTTITVFCLATEKESKECTDLFINFKSNIQAQSTQNSSIKLQDVRSVSKLKGNDKLADKLVKKLDTVHAIIVVCSPTLKGYLDEDAASKSDLLKGDERRALLRSLTKHNKKVVLVYLDDKFVNDVPQILKGNDSLHGLNGFSELAEVKLPALYCTSSAP